MAIFPVLYAGGYLTQLIENYSIWQKAGHIPGDGTAPSLPQKGSIFMSQRSIFLDGVKGAVFPWISDFCYRSFCSVYGKGEKR